MPNVLPVDYTTSWRACLSDEKRDTLVHLSSTERERVDRHLQMVSMGQWSTLSITVSFQYYTRRYSRPTSQLLDDQLNHSLPSKRPSLAVCDQSTKSTSVVVLSSSPIDASRRTGTIHHHHHVTSFSDPSASLTNRQLPVVSRSLIIVQVNVEHNYSSKFIV